MRLLCQEEYLLGAKAKTEEIVKEEVVELVGSHKVFRLLDNLPVFPCRNKFRADRSINDIGKNCGCICSTVSGSGGKVIL